MIADLLPLDENSIWVVGAAGAVCILGLGALLLGWLCVKWDKPQQYLQGRYNDQQDRKDAGL